VKEGDEELTSIVQTSTLDDNDDDGGCASVNLK
jgi:hypothetical protein